MRRGEKERNAYPWALQVHESMLSLVPSAVPAAPPCTLLLHSAQTRSEADTSSAALSALDTVAVSRTWLLGLAVELEEVVENGTERRKRGV